MSEELCKSCFKTAETEPVQVKRDGEWVDSPTVRRCVNPECHSVRTGTLADRLEWVDRIYGYKYFGDYELSPEQLDAVMEAWVIAHRVPKLTEALSELLAHSGYTHMSDGDLREEERLGNGFAPILLKARQALSPNPEASC